MAPNWWAIVLLLTPGDGAGAADVRGYAGDACTPHVRISFGSPIDAPRPGRAPARLESTTPPSSRLPSPYIRDYGPHAPAWPAPESMPPPREKPSAAEHRSGAAPSAAPGYYDIYPVAPVDASVPAAVRAGLRSVTFWNLSNGLLTLRAGGRAHVLERSKQVTLQLPHPLVWQVDGRKAETISDFADRPELEIVIRR